jgi:TolA-binding protein
MKKLISIIILILSTLVLKAQSFETVMNKTYVLLTIAQERDQQAAERLDETKSKRIRVEEDLMDMKERSGKNVLQKKEVEKLEKQVKSLKSQEKEIAKMRQESADFLSDVTDIIKDSEKNRARFIADYEKRNGKIPDVKTVDTQTVTSTPNIPEPATTDKIAQLEHAASIPQNQDGFSIDNNPNVVNSKADNSKNKKDKKGKDKKDKKGKVEINSNPTENFVLENEESTAKYVLYDVKSDVNLNPPAPDCRIPFDGLDNFTGKRKKETAPIILFRHTEDFMRPTLKEKDYITCEAWMSRVQGGFYFLNLTFTILTKEGQKSFGFLDRNTPFIFRFINGSNVILQNAKTDIGNFDTEKGISVYKAQIQMGSTEAKALGSAELDALRVTWSAGYEDYEIYDMDALMNLFKCLEKENK